MAGLIAAQTMSRHAPAADEALAAVGASAASAATRSAPPPVADALGIDAASTPSATPATSGPAVLDASVVTRAASAVVLPAAGGEALPSPLQMRPVAPVVAAASASAPAGTQADIQSGPAVTPALPPTQAASTPTVVTVARPATPAVSWPPNIKPVIDVETARAAKRDSAAMRAQGGALPPAVVTEAPGAVADGRKATPNAAASSVEGVTYALAARSTRSRAASELLLGLMKTAAAAGGDKAQQRTEILPSQQGWRAIWWPFHSRQDAERAQALLANVGLEAELLEF
jgi:hypothetical protein